MLKTCQQDLINPGCEPLPSLESDSSISLDKKREEGSCSFGTKEGPVISSKEVVHLSEEKEANGSEGVSLEHAKVIYAAV